MSSSVPRVIGGAACAIGAALSLLILFITFMGVLTSSRVPAIPRFTRGTVVGYDMPNTDATGRKLRSPLYFPLVNYHDRAGVECQFLSDAGSAQRTYTVGDRVRVVYSPHSKGGREIVSPSTTWGARVWLGWILAVGALIAILPLIAASYALLNGRRIRDVIALRHAPKTA